MAWQHYDYSDDPRTERAGHSATVVGKYVYVCGGRRGSYFFEDLIRYDTDSHSWETIYEKLPFVGRANHTATLVEAGPSGGKEVWFVGGQTNDDVVSDCWVLELDCGSTWRQVHVRDERMLLLRTAHTAELHPRHPNEILIFGGFGGGSGEYSFVNSLASLDTQTGEVAELRPKGVPPSGRAYHTCTAIGHVLYVFGGRDKAGVIPGDDPTLLCAYDALENAWCALSPGSGAHGRPPCARSSHRAVAFAGRAVIFGGTPRDLEGSKERMGDIHTLYIAPGGDVVWSACDDPGGAGQRPTGRSAHAMVLVGNQDMTVMGGYAGGGGGGGGAGGKGRGQQYQKDVWTLRLDKPAASRCPEVQAVCGGGDAAAAGAAGQWQRGRPRTPPRQQGGAAAAAAGGAAAGAAQTGRKRGAAGGGRGVSPPAAAAGGDGEWKQAKRPRQPGRQQQPQQQQQQRPAGLQQHPLLRRGGAAPADVIVCDQQPLGGAAGAAAAGAAGLCDSAPTPGRAANPAAAAAASAAPGGAAAAERAPSPPRSPEYYEGRSDGFAEAMLRKDNETLRSALEAERRSGSIVGARLADAERALAECRARAAAAEAAAQTASDAADGERRRAERALADAQREAGRRMAAEQRAADAEAAHRDQAAACDSLASQLAEARRAGKARGDEAAQLQAALKGARAEKQAAEEAAARFQAESAASWARQEAELQEARAKAAAAEGRAARLAESLARAEETAKQLTEAAALGDQERAALQQLLDAERGAAEAARAQGGELEKLLAASRQEAAAARDAAAAKEAQIQSLQEQLSRLQADHAALGQRLAQERQRAADDTAAHRRALEGQAASLDAALRAAAASFTGALQQEFNRADARRAAGADGSGA